MIIKDRFELLQEKLNVFNFSSSLIESIEVKDAVIKMVSLLRIFKSRVNHYTKDYVYNFLDHPKLIQKIKIVNVEKYPLPISYNKATDSIIVNLISTGTDDITRIDSKTLYSIIVYGIGFRRLVKNDIKISGEYANYIVNFMLSILLKLFGKSYGLVGIYSTEIDKLKFILSCYILSSFFGLENKNLYNRASDLSKYDSKNLDEELLKSIDFNSVEGFIKALDIFKIMPGINKYIFTMKFYSLFGSNFLPALEDMSRFLSIMTITSLTGNTISPTFISKYNETEYNKLMDICKLIYK